MKRILSLFLVLLFYLGCANATSNNFSNELFSAEIPEPFERVESAGILCFAPYGDALHASSIVVYTTELNWYFNEFTDSEYQAVLSDLTGFDSISVTDVRRCKIDGYDARRIACSVQIEQGSHDLILYAVSADRIYFFSLINRDTDNYVEPFDTMMKSVSFTGER